MKGRLFHCSRSVTAPGWAEAPRVYRGSRKRFRASLSKEWKVKQTSRLPARLSASARGSEPAWTQLCDGKSGFSPTAHSRQGSAARPGRDASMQALCKQQAGTLHLRDVGPTEANRKGRGGTGVSCAALRGESRVTLC